MPNLSRQVWPVGLTSNSSFKVTLLETAVSHRLHTCDLGPAQLCSVHSAL